MQKFLNLCFFLITVPLAALAQSGDILLVMENTKELKLLDNSCPYEIFKESEIQYRDYIQFCSNDMQLCLNKCIKGSANHCYGLANNLQVEKWDKVYSERLFSMACKQGLVTACTNRAAGIMRYNPDKKECYAKSFKLTCDKNDAWGCTMYGLVLSRGIGLEKNQKLALKVLKTGCMHGIDDEACKYAKAIEEDILSANKL